MARRRRHPRRTPVAAALLLLAAAAAVAVCPGRPTLVAAAVARHPCRLSGGRVPRGRCTDQLHAAWRPRFAPTRAAGGTEEPPPSHHAGGDEGAEEPEAQPEDDEGLGRLQANAVAAWLVNIALVVWIVYLYQRAPSEDSSQEIITLLSQELADQSTALTSDRRLKEDLQQEAEAFSSLARRMEDSRGAPQPPLLGQLQALLADRDAELQRGLEATERELRQAAERSELQLQRQRLVDDSVMGPLMSSASGVLAGVDVTIAAQFISLALLFSFATGRLQRGGPGAAAGGGRGGAAAAATAAAAAPEAQPPAQEDGEERERQLRSKNVLRFYGRWDEDREWVLLQSVALKGAASTVIGSVRSARGWMGGWSDRIITGLVARSARGMVRRRGWKRIVEQTMREVGRTFSLGYLLETAADKASPRIGVDSREKAVLEVPSSIVLEP